MVWHGAARMILGMLACVVLLSPNAWAQLASSGIAGVVRDTSGGVLPGVTVEAASPALIEKVRSAVTDSGGRYNIVDLRPGTYTVTFTLAGFGTFRREGVVLTASFTATVNADLQVGALQETVTVSGAAPLVDTQNVRQQNVLTREVLDTLPMGTKTLQVFATMTPGLVAPADVGGSRSILATAGIGNSGYHGKKETITVQFDSMRIQHMNGTSAFTAYIVNTDAVEELVAETGGLNAESAATGAVFNMIPKQGGNTFNGSVSGLFTTEGLQSDNLNDGLRARGLTSVNKVLRISDLGVTYAGPIKQDQLWFFAAHRRWGNRIQLAGLFYNKTQGTMVYTPDLDRPAYFDESYRSHVARLTWQASPKNKVGFYGDLGKHCLCPFQSGFNAPEALTSWRMWPNGLFQGTWSSPITNNLLFEAGASAALFHWPNYRQPGVSPDVIPITELSTGFRYNALPFNPNGQIVYGPLKISDRYHQRFAVSYVTGSHTFKAGFQIDEGVHKSDGEANGPDGVSYGFNRGVPSFVTLPATPWSQHERMKADLGLYVQDRWTLKRLTLNMGLRYDYVNAYIPEQHLPAGPFVPARDFAPVYDVPLFHDLSPRLGASYDLFGNGRTALKVTMARYLNLSSMQFSFNNNPTITSVNTVNRGWTDDNRNYVPDCDLRNPAQNGECGPLLDRNFGKNNPRATRYAEDARRGFGVRPFLWDVAAQVQHELASGVSVSAGYYRNWAGNFTVTNNEDVVPADYNSYCITAPTERANGFLLPGGGGYQVCGLYDGSPTKVGRITNLVTQASHYGKKTQVSNFFDVNLTARRGSGMRFGGGVDTGRTVTDSCFVVDSPQELLNCRVVTPWAANLQVKLHGSYPLPGDFQVSGVFQNVAGPAILANYPAPNAEIARTLGRNLAACGTRVVCTSTATVPLIVPGTQFEDRRSQLDLRLSKLVRLGSKVRLEANFDVYNVLNSSAILSLVTTYGPQWQRPQEILQGRLFEFGGKLTF